MVGTHLIKYRKITRPSKNLPVITDVFKFYNNNITVKITATVIKSIHEAIGCDVEIDKLNLCSFSILINSNASNPLIHRIICSNGTSLGSFESEIKSKIRCSIEIRMAITVYQKILHNYLHGIIKIVCYLTLLLVF